MPGRRGRPACHQCRRSGHECASGRRPLALSYTAGPGASFLHPAGRYAPPTRSGPGGPGPGMPRTSCCGQLAMPLTMPPIMMMHMDGDHCRTIHCQCRSFTGIPTAVGMVLLGHPYDTGSPGPAAWPGSSRAGAVRVVGASMDPPPCRTVTVDTGKEIGTCRTGSSPRRRRGVYFSCHGEHSECPRAASTLVPRSDYQPEARLRWRIESTLGAHQTALVGHSRSTRVTRGESRPVHITLIATCRRVHISTGRQY
jgi:hypothetical protein